jgi:cytochrome c553
VVSLPASVREAASAKDRNFTIIVCLSCHDGSVARNNSRHHPVGPGATSGWDHAVAGQREVFARNYRFPSKNNTQTITCTTCHDPHNQTMWSGEIGGVQANWRTSFFVRGPYSSSGGNAAAQFCRSCHADKSNEMHGLMNVPTIGVRQL